MSYTWLMSLCAALAPPAHVLPALHKTLEVGALCNGASIHGKYFGQAMDVILLNALSAFCSLDL
jgi:hypothetical protein